MWLSTLWDPESVSKCRFLWVRELLSKMGRIEKNGAHLLLAPPLTQFPNGFTCSASSLSNILVRVLLPVGPCISHPPHPPHTPCNPYKGYSWPSIAESPGMNPRQGLRDPSATTPEDLCREPQMIYGWLLSTSYTPSGPSNATERSRGGPQERPHSSTPASASRALPR